MNGLPLHGNRTWHFSSTKAAKELAIRVSSGISPTESPGQRPMAGCLKAPKTLSTRKSFLPLGGFFDLSRPMAVVGYGDGELPRLVGEAYGVVGVGGTGAVTLPISGEAHGEADAF